MRVPADNVDLVGVRDVVNQEGLDRVFNVLRQPYTEEPTNWSRRYKANLEKLASGDVIVCATGVTDGALLKGVKFGPQIIETETVIYRSVTGTVRKIQAQHREMGKFRLD